MVGLGSSLGVWDSILILTHTHFEMNCGCQYRFGIPFWLVGEFTTHFEPILVVGLGCSLGVWDSILILTHTHFEMNCGCQYRFGIPFWLVGEFTTHFEPILAVGLGSSLGVWDSILILTHTHFEMNCGCQYRFGIPFWLVGEFTTHFEPILVVGLGSSLGVRDFDPCPNGCGSKLSHQGTAGSCLWFHLPGFHFGHLFLTHSHVGLSQKLVQPQVVQFAHAWRAFGLPLSQAPEQRVPQKRLGQSKPHPNTRFRGSHCGLGGPGPALTTPLSTVDTAPKEGQNPIPPVNIPLPTKIGSKMGGAPTPK